MSAGRFEIANYEWNPTTIYGVKVQEETDTLTIGGVTNAQSPDARNQTVRARVSGARRGYGVFTRLVTIVFTGTPPAGYVANGVITLPWFQRDTFSALLPDAVGTYLGAPIRLLGTREQKRR